PLRGLLVHAGVVGRVGCGDVGSVRRRLRLAGLPRLVATAVTGGRVATAIAGIAGADVDLRRRLVGLIISAPAGGETHGQGGNGHGGQESSGHASGHAGAFQECARSPERYPHPALGAIDSPRVWTRTSREDRAPAPSAPRVPDVRSLPGLSSSLLVTATVELCGR